MGALVQRVLSRPPGVDREANHPSSVLRGVVGLTIAVGLLCFCLLSLVPIAPLDGYRLVRLALGDETMTPAVVDRVGVVVLLVVPVWDSPPLVTLLDLVGAPLMGLWA